MGMVCLVREQEGRMPAAALEAGRSLFISSPSVLPWQQWRTLFFMFWNCKHWLTLQIFLHAWEQAPRPGVKKRNKVWWQQPEPLKCWELLFPENHWWLSKWPWHAVVWQPSWLVCYSNVISRFTARKSEKSNNTFFPECLDGQTGLLLIFLCPYCLHLIHPQLSYQSCKCVCSICSTSSNAIEQQHYPVGMGEFLWPHFRSPQVLWIGKFVLDSCISRGGIK